MTLKLEEWRLIEVRPEGLSTVHMAIVLDPGTGINESARHPSYQSKIEIETDVLQNHSNKKGE